MKPQLPNDIADLFPTSVLAYIYKFVPHLPKPKHSPSLGFSVSPNMERDLRVLQYKSLKGNSEMYMFGLDDFVLDRILPRGSYSTEAQD
jgi:hypothetical protein